MTSFLIRLSSLFILSHLSVAQLRAAAPTEEIVSRYPLAALQAEHRFVFPRRTLNTFSRIRIIHHITDPSATAAAPVEILSALFSPDLFRALAAAVRACDANRQSGYLAKETVTISVGFRYDLISGCSVIDLTHPHHPFAVY